MEGISIFTIILFLLTSVGTVWFFYRATNNSFKVLAIILVWAIIQSTLAVSGFYQKSDAIPPRLIFLVAPWLLLTIIVFNLKATQECIDLFDVKWLTILHIIRTPVEVTLYMVLAEKLIPQSMTFEGTNFDILSGMSAPIVYHLAFKAERINQKLLLVWEFYMPGFVVEHCYYRNSLGKDPTPTACI